MNAISTTQYFLPNDYPLNPIDIQNKLVDTVNEP